MGGVARVLSVPAIGAALLIVVGHVVVPEPTVTGYAPVESLLPLLMFLNVAGLAMDWRWKGLCGAAKVGLCLANLAQYWGTRGRFMLLRPPTILSRVIVPGALFLKCWWRSGLRSSS
jgi:hypothetical protein